MCAWDLLKEVAIMLGTSTIVWPRVKQYGGNIALSINRNWIKDLLSMAPPIRTRPRVLYSPSLQSVSSHKPLFLIV